MPNTDQQKAESFINANNDSAFYYFNKIATSSTDSLQVATAWSYMGTIQNYEGDYYGAQESLLTSLNFLDDDNGEHLYCLMADYHELGNNSIKLKNYGEAIKYLDKALDYMDDTAYRVIALNSKALAYQKKGEYKQAIAIYSSILELSKKNTNEYARILSNYAKVKWQDNPAYYPVPEMLRALQIRRQANDKRGLNASYAHLCDYYSVSRPDSALFYAKLMYEMARQIDNPDNEIESLTKLIALSPSESLKHYFARYQYLNDSIQTARNTAKNQFALIRYEAEKTKADNLQLQKDNAQKRFQLVIQQFIFCIIMLLFIATVIYTVLWYKKRRRQIEFESQQAIQEHQLNTSKKVHDVVANGLYSMMVGLEHQEMIDKEILLDKIEMLYEKSRDISYEQPVIASRNFHERIAALLSSFVNAATNVFIAGNTEKFWQSMSAAVQAEVEQVLQELMINMKKHSKAQNVAITFLHKDKLIQINYADNGIGLQPGYKYGNGLTNTENRIKMLGGQLSFDETATEGLKIRITFPTA